jgi:YD repeat-containing protein
LEPGNENPTTYSYDSAGNLRTIVDPLGHTQEYVYDERGRITQFIDENDASTIFAYHADNQRHRLTDPADNTTTWTYDGAGRLHTETNELGHTRTYFYDEFNRLAEVEDRNGRIVRYDYDGRTLASEEWIENSTTVRLITYDHRSNPVLGGTSGQIGEHPGDIQRIGAEKKFLGASKVRRRGFRSLTPQNTVANGRRPLRRGYKEGA